MSAGTGGQWCWDSQSASLEMHSGLFYLARNAVVTVGEADHPRSLAHPQHDDGGQHLHTNSGTLLRGHCV